MMKSLSVSTALVLSLIVSPLAIAHEGHDHGPGQIQAPKGGVIRSLETIHLELLSSGKTVSIYAYDMALKAVDVSKYVASASIELPKKKAEPLAIVAKGDHWEAQFDPKGAHRYTLLFSIKQGGHDDKVKFTVEPKR